MEKTQNSNEETIVQKNELGEGEKAEIVKRILKKHGLQETPKASKEITTMELDVDMSRLYEAMSTFFNGMANVFNQFANGCNAASNNFKDQAIQILRDRAKKENKDES